MALTVTEVDSRPVEGIKMKQKTIDFDSSYPTGGESLTPADLGLSAITFILIAPQDGYVFEWDSATEKVIARYQTDPADAGGANVALVEVDNATDLQTVTGVRVLAFGV